MMRHAWEGYSSYAWGKNELRPVSKRGHSASIFGSAAMGASIIDGMVRNLKNRVSSHLGARLRDWANRQASAGCYSWAELSSNDSKTRYTGNL